MKKFYLILLLAPLLVMGQEISRPKVCLNMIVKDESSVIERSLSSVKPIIDYWIIVDTGSSDNTKEIIKNFLKDIPGELHERPWVDFEYNRNEALMLAKNKGDYLLFIDADEKLDFPESFTKTVFDKDYYFTQVRQDNSNCLRVLLIKNALDWKWKGVLHEELICPTARTFETLHETSILAHFKDSARARDPKKFLKDAQVLEAALEKDPTNTRYVSFLAQSYLCAKEYQLALKNFQKRATMGDREDEVFWALYQTACMQERLGFPSAEIIASFSKAYESRPSRAEPLFALGLHLYDIKSHVLGYAVCKLALSIPYPTDVLYVEYPVYEYQLPFLLANHAYYLGKYEEAAALYKLILSKNLPIEAEREISTNLAITHQRIKETR